MTNRCKVTIKLDATTRTYWGKSPKRALDLALGELKGRLLRLLVTTGNDYRPSLEVKLVDGRGNLLAEHGILPVCYYTAGASQYGRIHEFLKRELYWFGISIL